MKQLIPLVRKYSKAASLLNTSLAELSNTKSTTKPTSHNSNQPTTPARTRFAPSPTGFLHLGSLRTALYNYLLARSTGGSFILRIEDTDRTRLVPGAEDNIYDTLEWCGLQVDEGVREGGEFGPYRQSDRKEIYVKYAQQLLDSGMAYKCYCTKSRLMELRESAKKLKPPTNVTYDRKCVGAVDQHGEWPFVVRFKSPDTYPPFKDLLHGELSLQPQYNERDRRYDDFVIMKNDGMPTYHFANVVDDHLMRITHVVRGEEWLPSTPKHIALYRAFGWKPPQFIHIPLLTSLEDKKLSKRSHALNILKLKEEGVLPEALVNFVTLFGWAPVRESGEKFNEVMNLDEIVKRFSLDQLTKGNAKVSELKLYHFNKLHLTKKLEDPEELKKIVEEYYPRFHEFSKQSKEYLCKLLKYIGPNITTINDIESDHMYLFQEVEYSTVKVPNDQTRYVIEYALANGFEETMEKLTQEGIPKKSIFMSVRFALSGGTPGLSIPHFIDLMGEQEFRRRLTKALEVL
ncbi:Glutamate--tRNA ligase, mitochondrial [Candida viswanathii]|uniref:Glutamate--tRNA ligase, mitochondrial n=1 Tax=Candida viswanathii TaxID=5486 RepID=A0A367XZE8_9ASCO|nr:Glutamate--tRNA ligase, mitochondrial [Candida viswanathii]